MEKICILGKFEFCLEVKGFCVFGCDWLEVFLESLWDILVFCVVIIYKS